MKIEASLIGLAGIVMLAVASLFLIPPAGDSWLLDGLIILLLVVPGVMLVGYALYLFFNK